MGFYNIWPVFLLLTIPAVIMLYILKRKYKEVIVSSSFLWTEVYKNTRANTPWEKLRKNIMLLLQVLILLALILALMKPFINYGGKVYKNIIVVIDNTASMSALYDDGSRLEESKKMAKEYINSVNEGTKTYIISYDGNSNLLLNGDFHKEKVNEVIDGINQSYGSGDVNEVISFVKAIGSGIGENFEVVVFTDEEIAFDDLNGKVVTLAKAGINASIDNLAQKFVEDKFKVIATVTNRGTEEYQGDFSLYDGEDLLAVESLNLSVNESKTLSFTLDNIKGQYLKGELSRKDLISEDNSFYHVMGENKTNKILLVTEQNVFLEKAFAAIGNAEVYKTNDISNISSEDNYDLYVFDNITPDILPARGSLLFINPSSNELFKVNSGGEMGEAIAVKRNLSKYLETIQFTLSKYKIIETPYYGEEILTVNNQCIAFKGEINDRKVAALSFDLHDSDFTLKKEFPILIYELGEEFVDSGMVYNSNYKAGEKVLVKSENLDEKVTVIEPSGNETILDIGDEVYVKEELGIYALMQEEDKEFFSVNFPSEGESDTNEEVLEERENTVKEIDKLKTGVNIAPILIILAMIIIGFEWIMYKKGN